MSLPHHGRGASLNPQNRFEHLRCVPDPDIDWGYLEENERPLPRTKFLQDDSDSILSHNQSPDLGFNFSVNPYRGCEHGCAYCYARPTHEYLGFSAGLDFETRILVKTKAPALLRAAFRDTKWQPEVVMMSGITDCYQPAERQFQLTRGCLEVFAEFRNPVSIITKNYLVTRDIDLLTELAAHCAVLVTLSITTLDSELARKLEPRASSPARRLAAIDLLSRAGIPVSVNVAPIIPGLNDHEIPKIIQAAAAAGAKGGGWTLVRLPYGVKDVFSEWLATHFPEKKEGVLSRIRSFREGKLNDAEWGTRMTGIGSYAENIASMFRVSAVRAGWNGGQRETLTTTAFRRPGEPQQLEFL